MFWQIYEWSDGDCLLTPNCQTRHFNELWETEQQIASTGYNIFKVWDHNCFFELHTEIQHFSFNYNHLWNLIWIAWLAMQLRVIRDHC